MKKTAVDALLRPYAAPDVPGASVLVAWRGQVVYQQACGLADLETSAATITTTNYRLASVSKQFTATAVMLLAQRNQLNYTDTLPCFFPGFPAYGRAITIHHLLTHTAGLPDYEDLIPPTTQTPLQDRDVLALLQTSTAGYFPPDSAFRYSNSGYALLALIVERVSGCSFADFLAHHIFQPLGMTGAVAFQAGVSQVAHRAFGYHATANGFTRRDQNLTSSVLGDGGIYACVEDLFRWDQALYTNQLLRADSRVAAWTPHVWVENGRLAYGYGWFIEPVQGRVCHWHFGSTTGFRTAVERFPQEALTVIVLLNRDEPDGQEMAAHTLARQIAAHYLPDSRR